MVKTIKILCVHGLGDKRSSDWQAEWENAVRQAIGPDAGVNLDFDFLTYDPIFAETSLSFGETMGAVWKLARSGISNIFRSRGLIENISDHVRWTAGYMVAWVNDKEFQEKTRKLVLDRVRTYKPDVILAHSLGTLITYNAFAHDDARIRTVASPLRKTHYVTFGSQIGNPFVLGNLTHGRVKPLPVAHWHNLFNEHDDLFTSSLRVQGTANFNQLLTPFDRPGGGDHDVPGYLTHATTRASFWAPLVSRFAQEAPSALARRDPWSRSIATEPRGARRKALLVGIDRYPNEADCLYGCVNDVFSMSATLQDCGFGPEEIRTCLNERATAANILSRLEWLTQDARAGDTLVFYYSGHGARVPEYGINQEPDRLTETLVPHDFDWTPERGISDEQIYDLYAQLPYDLRFLMIFDCCHSGSMHRLSSARGRGIDPPDDIRHRELRWNTAEGMWEQRKFDELNADFAARGAEEKAQKFFGANEATVRIGRAAPLRKTDRESYEEAKAHSDGPVGPFLPLIIEACAEDELAYEYRHGTTSYGAFTFCLVSILRQERDITFADLVTMTTQKLARLGYRQQPQILGPKVHVGAKVPFRTGSGSDEHSGPSPGSQTPRTSG